MIKIMKLLFLITLILTFHAQAIAQTNPSEEKNSAAIIDLPMVDAPYNFLNSDFTWPSMRQSMAVSSSFYEVTHRALMGPQDGEQRWRIWLVAGFDVLSNWIPGGNAWVHEEWHRAVMGRRGIDSYDDVYNFPIGQSSIAVSHVKDSDLIRLKRDHPAEQVRMSAAGMEAQTSQNLYLQQSQFFKGTDDNNRILFLMNDIDNIGYLATCASTDADKQTQDFNDKDGTHVMRRDFTGLDCNAWVYDLFRPDEPYAVRGTHPSGIGINRYITWSELSSKEQEFLRRQVYLSTLNLVDPFIWWFRDMHADLDGHDVIWNAKLSHYLTSFGYTVNAHLFVKSAEQKFLFELHNGFNYKSYFPGITVSSIDYPLWNKWMLTTGATLWPQPKGQRFDQHSSEWLAAGNVEVGYQVDPRIQTYLGINAKTPGWMAGEVFLDRAVSVWTGVRVGVF
jgi:hypothetical protein